MFTRTEAALVEMGAGYAIFVLATKKLADSLDNASTEHGVTSGETTSRSTISIAGIGIGIGLLISGASNINPKLGLGLGASLLAVGYINHRRDLAGAPPIPLLPGIWVSRVKEKTA